MADEINKQLGNASVTLSDGSSIKMDTKVKAQVVEAMGADGKPTGEKTIAFTFKEGAKESNTLEVLQVTLPESVLDALHLNAGDTLTGRWCHGIAVYDQAGRI